MSQPERGAIPGGQRTAQDVERAILSGMANRTYAVGERLPTCEELGRELGANKNTVSKAYQTLARRGYLRSSPGRGTFVLKRPRHVEPAHARREVVTLVTYALEQAARAGMDAEKFSALVREVVERHMRSRRIRIGFVDCNRLDAVQLGRDLEEAVGSQVVPLVLDDVLAAGARRASGFDILAVSASHCAALDAGLKALPLDDRPEVIPILAMPDPASIMEVARLGAGTRLGVVADSADPLHTLVNLTRAFNAGVSIQAATSDSEGELRTLLDAVDVLLVTMSADQHIVRYEVAAPVIRVNYRIDDHSAEMLAARIAERADSVAAPTS